MGTYICVCLSAGGKDSILHAHIFWLAMTYVYTYIYKYNELSLYITVSFDSILIAGVCTDQ